MPIRARVGRHTRSGGRHCQNWADDQKTVIDLLNLVTIADGGAGGKLAGPVIAGVCSDALYGAISRFEDKYFPGQRSGYLDPGGAMLRRMEQLAGRTPGGANAGPKVIVDSVAALNTLDVLRGNLLDDTPIRGKWTAGERVAMDQLIKMAVSHVDYLHSLGLSKLPWPVEMFGRAYIRPERKLEIARANDDGTVTFEDLEAGDQETPELPLMRHGQPVDIGSHIFTGKLSALLLYDTGYCLRVRAYSEGRIDYLGVFPNQQPRPIVYAEKFGVT
jgi:hypothetical protein